MPARVAAEEGLAYGHGLAEPEQVDEQLGRVARAVTADVLDASEQLEHPAMAIDRMRRPSDE